jgi:hypothetical protein
LILTRAQHELGLLVLPLFTRLVAHSPDDRAEVLAGLTGLSPSTADAVRELLALDEHQRNYARRVLSWLVDPHGEAEIPRPRFISGPEAEAVVEVIERALEIDDALLVTLVDDRLGTGWEAPAGFGSSEDEGE